ncbi:MAG: polysaccharide deacetylase family protein [Bacteroidales bacterium]|nr:polysaccharide deacetylase family protein [Bacteroidales bacterium]
MRSFRPGPVTRLLFPEAVFRVNTPEKLLYLTFDDGPDPVSTPGLLDELDELGVQGVFFCSGHAAERFPELVERTRRRGHIIGNHGYEHLCGWKTQVKAYLDNVEKAVPYTSGSLFRPPYGKMTPSQYRGLKSKFRIIMWDIMAWDFDPRFSPERSLNVLTSRMRPGSVIVLHDIPSPGCRSFLRRFVETAKVEGFNFAGDI